MEIGLPEFWGKIKRTKEQEFVNEFLAQFRLREKISWLNNKDSGQSDRLLP